MHDCMTKTTTVEALSEIIKFLKNESYTFKTLK
jgi:peptidoglycan-N-acetylglucosamine deacetylase